MWQRQLANLNPAQQTTAAADGKGILGHTGLKVAAMAM
jgi:hypothetical protein